MKNGSLGDLLNGMSQKERKRWLSDNATKIVDNFSFARPLDESESETMKQHFVETSHKIAVLERKKKEVNAELNGEKKVLKQRAAELLDAIHTGHLDQTETVFDFADHENGRMETYSADGYFIKSRPLLPGEQQTSILTTMKNEKNGTEN